MEADMIPIDFGSTRSTGINAFAYYKLKTLLNIKGPIKIYDMKQLLADPDNEILEMFQSDCIQLKRLAPSCGLKINNWKSFKMMDGNIYEIPLDYNPVDIGGNDCILDEAGNIVLKRPKEGLYFDDVYAPLKSVLENDEIDRYIYPHITNEETSFLKKNAQDLFFNSEYAIVAPTNISIFEKGIKDFGFEEFLVKIYTEKKLIRRYLERLTEAYIQLLDKYLAAVGSYIQVLQFNDDLGMQNSSLISPDIYREIFKPFHQKIYGYAKKKAPHIFILLHSCGSIYDFIPDLIDVGIDALNPIQINAAKMDPAMLKKEFGDDITFWGGGLNTQVTLTFGTIKEIEYEVERMIDIFSPGGGFVFNQVHNIQANIIPEKIIAAYDTAIKKRRNI